MRVRDREGERGGAPRANSTCWGDGETAVTSTLFLLFFLLLCACFLPSSLFCATDSPSISVLLLLPPSSLTYSLKAAVASDRKH